MAPLTIIANGQATISKYPERAIVSVSVSANGTNQKEVTESVTRTATQLQSELSQLAPKDKNGQAAPNAPITHWSMTTMSTGSNYIYAKEDQTRVKETCFTANLNFSIRFADFGKLGAACKNLANMPHASIKSIKWEITDKVKKELTPEVRRLAVEDAVTKAQHLAAAVGKRTVVPVEISCHDFPRAQGTGISHHRAAVGTAQQGGEELNFEPANVDTSCQVTCKFEAL
jgi:uncharacterized protein YggE